MVEEAPPAAKRVKVEHDGESVPSQEDKASIREDEQQQPSPQPQPASIQQEEQATQQQQEKPESKEGKVEAQPPDDQPFKKVNFVPLFSWNVVREGSATVDMVERTWQQALSLPHSRECLCINCVAVPNRVVSLLPLEDGSDTMRNEVGTVKPPHKFMEEIEDQVKELVALCGNGNIAALSEDVARKCIYATVRALTDVASCLPMAKPLPKTSSSSSSTSSPTTSSDPLPTASAPAVTNEDDSKVNGGDAASASSAAAHVEPSSTPDIQEAVVAEVSRQESQQPLAASETVTATVGAVEANAPSEPTKNVADAGAAAMLPATQQEQEQEQQQQGDAQQNGTSADPADLSVSADSSQPQKPDEAEDPAATVSTAAATAATTAAAVRPTPMDMTDDEPPSGEEGNTSVTSVSDTADSASAQPSTSQQHTDEASATAMQGVKVEGTVEGVSGAQPVATSSTEPDTQIDAATSTATSEASSAIKDQQLATQASDAATTVPLAAQSQQPPSDAAAAAALVDTTVTTTAASNPPPPAATPTATTPESSHTTADAAPVTDPAATSTTTDAKPPAPGSTIVKPEAMDTEDTDEANNNPNGQPLGNEPMLTERRVALSDCMVGLIITILRAQRKSPQRMVLIIQAAIEAGVCEACIDLLRNISPGPAFKALVLLNDLISCEEPVRERVRARLWPLAAAVLVRQVADASRSLSHRVYSHCVLVCIYSQRAGRMPTRLLTNLGEPLMKLMDSLQHRIASEANPEIAAKLRQLEAYSRQSWQLLTGFFAQHRRDLHPSLLPWHNSKSSGGKNTAPKKKKVKDVNLLKPTPASFVDAGVDPSDGVLIKAIAARKIVKFQASSLRWAKDLRLDVLKEYSIAVAQTEAAAVARTEASPTAPAAAAAAPAAGEETAGDGDANAATATTAAAPSDDEVAAGDDKKSPDAPVEGDATAAAAATSDPAMNQDKMANASATEGPASSSNDGTASAIPPPAAAPAPQASSAASSGTDGTSAVVQEASSSPTGNDKAATATSDAAGGDSTTDGAENATPPPSEAATSASATGANVLDDESSTSPSGGATAEAEVKPSSSDATAASASAASEGQNASSTTDPSGSTADTAAVSTTNSSRQDKEKSKDEGPAVSKDEELVPPAVAERQASTLVLSQDGHVRETLASTSDLNAVDNFYMRDYPTPPEWRESIMRYLPSFVQQNGPFDFRGYVPYDERSDSHTVDLGKGKFASGFEIAEGRLVGVNACAKGLNVWHFVLPDKAAEFEQAVVRMVRGCERVWQKHKPIVLSREQLETLVVQNPSLRGHVIEIVQQRGDILLFPSGVGCQVVTEGPPTAKVSWALMPYQSLKDAMDAMGAYRMERRLLVDNAGRAIINGTHAFLRNYTEGRPVHFMSVREALSCIDRMCDSFNMKHESTFLYRHERTHEVARSSPYCRDCNTAFYYYFSNELTSKDKPNRCYECTLLYFPGGELHTTTPGQLRTRDSKRNTRIFDFHAEYAPEFSIWNIREKLREAMRDGEQAWHMQVQQCHSNGSPTQEDDIHLLCFQIGQQTK